MNSIVDENELVIAIARRDRTAFKQLYDIYSKTVYNLCLRMTGNSDDAAEISQDVFLALWQKAGSLRKECKLSTWLYRVAVNTAINYSKKGGVFAKFKRLLSLDSSEFDREIELSAPATSRPDRQLEIKNARNKLIAMVAKLSARQREVFLLHKLRGLSYKEIAAETKMSLPAVESALHRAKKRLRQQLLKQSQKEHK